MSPPSQALLGMLAAPSSWSIAVALPLFEDLSEVLRDASTRVGPMCPTPSLLAARVSVVASDDLSLPHALASLAKSDTPTALACAGRYAFLRKPDCVAKVDVWSGSPHQGAPVCFRSDDSLAARSAVCILAPNDTHVYVRVDASPLPGVPEPLPHTPTFLVLHQSDLTTGGACVLQLSHTPPATQIRPPIFCSGPSAILAVYQAPGTKGLIIDTFTVAGWTPGEELDLFVSSYCCMLCS